jgi:hypothetical protein
LTERTFDWRFVIDFSAWELFQSSEANDFVRVITSCLMRGNSVVPALETDSEVFDYLESQFR